MAHQSGRPNSGSSSARLGFASPAATDFNFGAHSGMKMLGSNLTALSPGQRPLPLRMAASKRPSFRSSASLDVSSRNAICGCFARNLPRRGVSQLVPKLGSVVNARRDSSTSTARTKLARSAAKAFVASRAISAPEVVSSTRCA